MGNNNTTHPTWDRIYHGEMTSNEAERWLLLQKDSSRGIYLVRNSYSQPDKYTLTVRDNKTIHHYLIHGRTHRGTFYVSEGAHFRSIQEMIEFYRTNAGLCVLLGSPCPKIQLAADNRLVAEWEIQRSDVRLEATIGQGQFAKVYKGVLLSHIQVAVKELKPGSMDPQDFLLEAAIMMKLKHKRLIHLFGVCSRRQPLFIVTALAPQGSLLTFFKNRVSSLSVYELVALGEQVAEGMSYLEQHHFLHLDLAARNVLVDENSEIKIADFGLSKFIKDRDVYVGSKATRFALKWTAPEAAASRTFTVKSDVWSFGVLLWEIITQGQEPYPGLSSMEALRRVEKGYIMLRPPECAVAPGLYDIMRQCWQTNPEHRPDFITLRKQLNAEKTGHGAP